MSITRRSLISATTLLPLVNIRRAHAGEFNLNLGNSAPAAHPLNIRLVETASRIAEQTDGQVQIKVYPSSKIATDAQIGPRVKSGELDFGCVTGHILADTVPLASIESIGFAFSDYKQVWGVLDGELGSRIRRDVHTAGMISVGRVFDNGFRQTTTKSKPIRTPGDFQGMKLRVPVSDQSEDMFKKLGATTTSMDLSSVYGALKNGSVDGQENPLALIQTAKFYEVQSYCSLTNHAWAGYWPIASAQLWSKLPAHARDIIEAEFDRGALQQRIDIVRLSPAARGDMFDAGVEVNAVNVSDFQEVLSKAGFYKQWRGGYGDAWQMLEQAVGPLA